MIDFDFSTLPTADTVMSAAASGDRLRTLKALREQLAEAIDSGAAPSALPNLTKRLMDVLDEIEKLESREDTTIDHAIAAPDEPL